ncbi:MAG: ArsA family ATPase [Eubacterium sp.]
MSRIIIFTGKGGVGKTSVAAAHARKASLEGKKTLIVSTDMAHNLGDLFECSLGSVETEIADGLYALEIDPNYEMTHEFVSLMSAFENIFPKHSKEADAMEALDLFPGIEELFSLLKIHSISEKGYYDLIVVDCAPTGETLSLLKFPELLSWYMEKMFPLGKTMMKVMRPVSKMLFKIQLPDGKAMNDIERLYMKLSALQELLRNREVCSIRLVTVPEKMVVEETKRNYMYLNLYNFNVDGLYINRILPKDIDNTFFKEWLEIQKGYIEELENVFAELPVYPIKWYDIDLNGLGSLDKMCEEALNKKGLFEVLSCGQNEVYEKTEKGYCLRVRIPGVVKDELEIHDAGDDLVLRIGNFKRNIPMPHVLVQYDIVSAKLKEEALEIYFEKEEVQ